MNNLNIFFLLKDFIILNNNMNYKVTNIDNLNEIKKDLVVEPINNYIETKKDLSFNIYKILNNNEILLPKFYFNDNIEYKEYNKKTKKTNISLEFKGKLRDYQNITVNDCYNTIIEKGGIILSLQTGQGKTVCAINLITKIKKKCLIIVHKSFLMNQWIERITEFTNLKKNEIGIIQGKKIDVENKNIVIGMLQSLSLKDYPLELFEQFDLTIVDECHHISSRSFSKALLKLRSKYSLGLTATPSRQDNLTHVFQKFLGLDIYKLKEPNKKKVEIKTFFYKNKNEDEKQLFLIKKIYNGNLNLSKMITNLTLSKSRNDFLLSKIPINKERNNLILSSRVEQLQYLCDSFRKMYPEIKSDLYIGKMKNTALKKAEEAQVLFGTYEMISEGFDLPKLNCLLFASPRSEIEQSCGRILRKVVENICPLIIDICDMDVPVFIAQYNKRKRFYIENEWHFK